MVRRILKFENFIINTENVMGQLNTFVKPNGVMEEGLKPTIIDHYAKSSKLVDRYNIFLAVLKYRYKIAKIKLVWFIYCIITITVNAWTIWNDIQMNTSLSNDTKFKRFCKKPCK
jgi:hypothetical protein